MTSRLRGSAKEEPKATSLLSSKNRTYLSSGREPREKSGFEGSRNKVSRKDSRGKYDGFPERSTDTRRETNGFGEDPDEDPDVLYRRSREHFGSWDIRDVIGAREASPERSKSDRKSRFDLFRSNGDGGGRIANAGEYSQSRSPDLHRDGHKSSEKNAPDKSPIRDKARRKSPGKGVDRTIERAGHEDEGHPPRNRALLREIENFGADRRGLGIRSNNESPERCTSESRRYAGNGISPERENDKIRQLIDRFKSSERNDDALRIGSSSKEKSSDWKSGTRGAGRPSPEGKVPRRTSRDRDEKVKENREVLGRSESDERNYNGGYRRVDAESGTRKFTEREHRINGDSRGSSEEGAFRKRSDTYSVERAPRKSRDFEEDSKGPSKRKSYAYSDSPENFDVQIQRYERALAGPRRDPEATRKNSPKERDPDVRRRSSLRTRDEPDENLERNGRHSRPLTPPEDDADLRDDRKFEDGGRTFDAKNWYESNRRFAAKYLEENSKVNGAAAEDRGVENDLEIRRVGASREIYFGDNRDGLRNAEEANHGQRYVSSLRMEGTENPHERKSNGKGEPITIKIRNIPEERSENERRTKRATAFLDAGEDSTNARNRRKSEESLGRKDGRWNRNRDWSGGTATPARKIWSYREGGAQITDVDEGQPCLKCGETCPGFLQHSWRKNCNSCKCPREAHDVCHDEWVSVRSRLGLKGDGVGGSVSCEPRDLGLAWAPPGLPSHKVEEYFSMLPEVSVPRLGTPGERYRDRQLAMQLPKQDLAKAYCRHLAPEHYTSADDFMAARNEIALDIGTVQEILEKGEECAGCNEGLEYGSLAISAGKLGELYHPSCFQCVQCRELLVDLAYCVYNDAIYCERHYAERLKGRCPACDELIFSGEFTRAMNKDWHSGHFCCWQCDESLTGQRYVLRDEHPYCIKCYESVFANGCEECSKIIGIDSKDLSYKDKHWHEACFLCNKCRVSLVDKQFGSKVDKIYCGNCYDAQFASRCDGCGEIFRAGTKKMEYKTRQWHEKCFCCVVCKNPIGTKSFIPREQEIYCAGCYEDKFATRCVKCNKIITSGGVTYKNEPWHRECFTCSNCSTSLAGQRFTSRDEKPYCADCFGELFAKRCTACTKPITGIGGTRFISFEDRHWHNDCFICAGCKTSLVGRGFITDADDVICPECAKQKLM